MPYSTDPFAVSDAIAVAFRSYSDDVARLYVALCVSLTRVPGVVVASGSHGFIEHELRGYRDAEWCYSLVLNKRWVRLYVRAPELARGRLTPQQILSDFPQAELTAKGEVAVNLCDESLALAVCHWLEAR